VGRNPGRPGPGLAARSPIRTLFALRAPIFLAVTQMLFVDGRGARARRRSAISFGRHLRFAERRRIAMGCPNLGSRKTRCASFPVSPILKSSDPVGAGISRSSSNVISRMSEARPATYHVASNKFAAVLRGFALDVGWALGVEPRRCDLRKRHDGCSDRIFSCPARLAENNGSGKNDAALAARAACLFERCRASPNGGGSLRRRCAGNGGRAPLDIRGTAAVAGPADQFAGRPRTLR